MRKRRKPANKALRVKKVMIRDEADLPDWFNLEKYDGAQKLGADGWYEQFLSRAFLYHCVPPPNDTRFIYELKLMHSTLQEKGLLSFAPDYSYFVSSMDGGLLSYLKGAYDNQKPPNGVRIFSFQKLKATSMAGVTLGGFDTEKLVGLDTVQMHLALPTKELVRQFELYVRKKKSAVQRFKDTTLTTAIRNWRKQKILPYLDLLLWERANSKTITNKLLAKALWPDGTVGEENVRKTVEPRAMETISPDMLFALGSYAAEKRSEELL